ncbi:type I DNA topoisomerase [Lacticaseibacillus manihotivorans]|uniref:type I DNA topoisomerase n=1 Tax=Lacticaseibacillus manihotivorans TaxID=88233 RepID=UPI000AFE36B4
MTAKNLVIVESPAKAKTIEKYLGRNYKVVASLGHIRDLPKSQMGIDFEHDYEPKYISIRGKGDVIKDLKKNAKKADHIYLAADPDREGEAIAWHVSHILGLDPKGKNRVVFNEITKDAVKKCLQDPAFHRHELSRCPTSTPGLRPFGGLFHQPAIVEESQKRLIRGRVQSVALKLIIDREEAIRAFVPEEYWTLDAEFKKGTAKKFAASFYGQNNKKMALKNNDAVQEVLRGIDRKAPFDITNVVKKERKRYPAPPFTTSSLQQEANRKLNFRTRKTMMLAQQLYEGINLGGKLGTVGLITYMRTDSTRVSNVAKTETSHFIHEKYGEAYAAVKIRQGKLQEGAQDAHEAIRPTSTLRTPESLEKVLDKDQMKLYRLIWSRFVASEMTPAVIDTVAVTIDQKGATFHANGSQTKFDGFTTLYVSSRDADQKDNLLPDLEIGDHVTLVKTDPAQHFTQPPARYSEANLVKALEENGVGRPSTYAPTIETIQKRYYVKLNARRFEPTELGEIVNSLICEFFPDIVDIKFTASVEGELDSIEAGEMPWVKVIDQFYHPFEKELKHAEAGIEKKFKSKMSQPALTAISVARRW